MAIDIGPRIGIDGEREFRTQLAQINESVKTLTAEEKALEAAMKLETDEEKKSAAMKDVLDRKLLAQKEKLDKLKEGLEASTKKYGEADVKTQKWKQAVYAAEKALSEMEGELGDADKKIDDMTESVDDAEEATSNWAGAMDGSFWAGVAAAGLSKLVDVTKDAASALWDASKAGAAYADEVLSMVPTTGLSTDTLQKYKYMSDLVDVSLDTVTGSLAKLTKNMDKARDGEGDAADAFAALGVSVKDQNGQLRKSEDVFNDVLDALGKIDNETERDAKSMTIFGKSAQDLNPLIEAGGDRLQELGEEAKKAGYVLSGSALSALGKQQDAMDKLTRQGEALKNKFAVEMAPGVTKAFEALSNALDNPRVQRGISVVAEGLGSVIEKVTTLAADGIPGLFKVFNMGDDKLRVYSDAQLELANRAEEVTKAHGTMIGEYKDNAQAIVQETERTQNLWAELQTLVSENGNVKQADQDRVDYILNELNDALGTEYERNGNIIGQYQTMQKEIAKLIKKREAEALLAAGSASFAEAEKNRVEALQAAADLSEAVDKAWDAYTKAEQAYAIADAYAKQKYHILEYKDALGNAYTNPEDALKYAAYMEEYTNAVNDTRTAWEGLTDDYAAAQETATQYYLEVDRWQRAQEAAAQDNYVEVVRILADEFGVTLDYYRQKKELKEQEKKDLENKIAEQERLIAEYKKNLEAGLAGFSETGLKELEDYVKEAKDILDGKSIGQAYLDGIEKGLRDKERIAQIKQAAKEVARSIEKSTKNVLQIASPSKVSQYFGQMYDEGLVVGLEKYRNRVERASEYVSGALVNGSTASYAGLGFYTGGAITAPIWAGGTSAGSYTTNLGGITIHIDGSDGVDEDVLAQRVAVRLTEELQRAQRGGRR